MKEKAFDLIKNKIKWFVFGVALVYFLFSCFLILQTNYNITMLTIISALLIIVEICLFLTFNIKISSIYCIFLLIFNIFYFGIPLALLFSSGFSSDSYLYWLTFAHSAQVTETSLCKAYLLSTICSFSLAVVRCLFTLRKHDEKVAKAIVVKFNNRRMADALLFSFIVLAAVSFFPYIWVQISAFSTVLKNGYASVYSISNVPGIVQTVASFFTTSLLFGCVYFCFAEGKGAKIFYFLITVFIALSLAEMIKGTRLKQTIYLIVAITLLPHRLKNKKNKILFGSLLAIAVFIGLSFLSYISFARNAGGATIGGFFEFIFSNGFLSVPAKAFIECGNTIKSLYLAIEYFPSYHDYFYGFTYISSFASVYPNTFNLYGDFVDYYSFVKFLPRNTQFSLGGSILGEAFANFGFIGAIIFMIIFSLALNYVCAIEKVSKEKNNTFTLFFCLFLYRYFLEWIRGYFVSMVFPSFVVFIVLFFSYLLLKSKNIRLLVFLRKISQKRNTLFVDSYEEITV